MDDLIILGGSPAEVHTSRDEALRHLVKLGWQINEEKSSLTAAQCTKVPHPVDHHHHR